MKYKLFITDYDGTLGHAPENTIDSETLSAINKFIDKGGVFVVCSGRETSSITKILRGCNLKGLVASFQGARITDIESGKSIFDGGLSLEKALEVLDAVDTPELTPMAYGDSEFYVSSENHYTIAYKNAVGLKCIVTDVRKFVKERKNGIFKICWVGDDGVVNAVCDRLNARYNGVGVRFNSGAKGLLEAINPDCSKGAAVRFLANYYGFGLDEVITVGDSTNDVDLVQGEWLGVAVGDGRDELKAVAKEITVPFKDKPVKVLLEKYCLED